MALSFPLEAQQSRIENRVTVAKRAAGKALSGIVPKLKQFGGWLIGSLTSFFNLSFQSLWDMLVQGYFAIKYFDFAQTDEALQKQIEANNQRLVTVGAEILGETLGFQTVRLANMFLGRFLGNKAKSTTQNMKIPVLSASVGLALAEEGNEEIAANVRRFLNATISSQVSNAFINTVLTARRNHWFGLNSITTTQTNGSIAQKIEDKIEKLPKFWQQPLEELIEGFEEGIIEAGYVVSFQIDDHVAAMRAAKRLNEVKRIVEVKTEPGSDEALKFDGSQENAIDTLNTTLMGTLPLIKNRDVGEIFAEPVDELVKLKNQLRKVTINFSEHSKPPFRRKGVLGKRSSISIPDARAGLKFNDLKNTVNEYTAGDTFVSVQLDNGRTMEGYFVSASEGEKVLTKLAALSTADLLPDTFRSSKGKSAGLTLATKRMNAVSASLLYPKRKDGKNSGIKGKPVKVSLWQADEPANFKPFV
jgi:hypothetical protein